MVAPNTCRFAPLALYVFVNVLTARYKISRHRQPGRRIVEMMVNSANKQAGVSA
jgi:hypothetical protein